MECRWPAPPLLEILERRDLSGTFDVVIGGEDVSEHKPHPEGCSARSRNCGSSPTKRGTWAIIPPTRKPPPARSDFVAVLTGVTTREDFAAHPVHHFLESMETLRGLIDAAFRGESTQRP